MWQLIITITLAFPGPVLEIDGQPVVMVTNSYRLAIQNFPDLQSCETYRLPANFPLMLTDALGNQTQVTVNPEAKRCVKQD